MALRRSHIAGTTPIAHHPLPHPSETLGQLVSIAYLSSGLQRDSWPPFRIPGQLRIPSSAGKCPGYDLSAKANLLRSTVLPGYQGPQPCGNKSAPSSRPALSRNVSARQIAIDVFCFIVQSSRKRLAPVHMKPISEAIGDRLPDWFREFCLMMFSQAVAASSGTSDAPFFSPPV